MDLKSKVRTIADYPKPGIFFRDITTLLGDREAFGYTIERLVDRYAERQIEKVAAVESRGFILGAPLAHQLGAGFVPLRKRGKLPAATAGVDYALEYGVDRLEVHIDGIGPGERVLVVDDLVATGGTALAACHLVRHVGGIVVECCFVIDLPDLHGRRKLEQAGVSTFALCAFDGA